LLHASAPFLPTVFEQEHFAFFGQVLSGQMEQEPRWKRAAHAIDGCLGEALGRLYVEKCFPPEARARMAELVDNLKAVYRDRLATVPWMTEATRAQALAKFDRFTQKIGHPDQFRDYSPIDIRPDDYFGNVRRAAAFESRREIVRIGQAVDRSEWHMTPETVNAYFNPSQNEIVFPAGILQPPFFDLAMDDAVNYGGIGVIIGHEMTHGYDDEGRKFDADGNLKDWWTEADAKAFEARAQKVADQFNAFEVLPGLHVNGQLTLGENLADLGGVTLAYEALERALARDPSRRKTIDGFTPEQRFFISFAQVWRMNVREAEVRRLITVDPHSPGKFRANGTLDPGTDEYSAHVATGFKNWRVTVAGLVERPLSLSLDDLKSLPSRIDFADAQHGLSVEFNATLYTRDGGDSWHKSSYANDVKTRELRLAEIGPNTFHATAARLVDAEYGWWSVEGDLFRTTDGGASWRQLESPRWHARLVRIHGLRFADRKRGWAVASRLGQPSPMPGFPSTPGRRSATERRW